MDNMQGNAQLHFSVLAIGDSMRAKIIPFLIMFTFVISYFALARDLSVRSRGGQSLRSAPSMKVPRSRGAPHNTVRVYPGLISPGPDTSSIGLEYNQHLREQINRLPPYVIIR